VADTGTSEVTQLSSSETSPAAYAQLLPTIIAQDDERVVNVDVMPAPAVASPRLDSDSQSVPIARAQCHPFPADSDRPVARVLRYFSGCLYRRPAKRAKSPSAVTNSQPCSRARAAW
jgi:hypothetical protein